MAKNYDLVVIGAGTGGYVASIRAAQHGLKVACIDKWINKEGKPALGGTCLNVGCIPSKALLESSHKFEDVSLHFAQHGIEANKPKMNVPKMISRKDGIVSELTGGISQLFKANKIDWLAGKAKLLANNQVSFCSHDDKEEILSAKNVIIATGSVPRPLGGVDFDDKYIHNSETALNWEKAPKKLAVIGAGVIGLEMGSIWSRLGSEVTVFENRPKLLPEADQDIAKAAQKIFKKQGLNFVWGVNVDSIKVVKSQVEIQYSQDDKKNTQKFDKVLVSIGRMPYTKDIVAGDVNLNIDSRGFIEVDNDCRTNITNVFAIGDVVRGPMLAHKSSDEGIMVADIVATGHGHINYDAIPMVVYTAPEIAWVGLTEQEAKEKGYTIKSGKFPFIASGRAKAMGSVDGLVKIISDATTDRILGLHIIGQNASELIGQGVMALEWESVTQDLQKVIFAHPSLSEAIHEAALNVDDKSIHVFSRKK